MKTVLLIFLVSLQLLCSANTWSDAGYDWPRWRGPEGNGVSRETGWNPKALATGPRRLWSFDLGLGYSNIAIKGNCLYAFGWDLPDLFVYCLNAGTGAVIWKTAFEQQPYPQSTPTLDESSVYYLGKEGLLSRLDAETGQIRWKKDLVSECGVTKPYFGFAGPPVVEGDLLILNANTSGMAFDKKTGNLVWGSDPPPSQWQGDDTTGAEYSTPVVFSQNGTRCALLYSWKGVSCVEASTGKLLWLWPWRTYYYEPKVPDPLVIGSRIFIACDSRAEKRERGSLLLQVDGNTPRLLWWSGDLFSDTTSPVLVDGFIYGGHGGPFSISRSATLRCLDPETGKLMWEQPLGSKRPLLHSVQLIATDGKLIILNDMGILSIAEADPLGYREISRCDVLGDEKAPRRFLTPPVLCNGRIYCRNCIGELVCIDVRH